MVTRRPEIQDHGYPPKSPERINHTFLLPHRDRQRRASTSTSYLTTASSFAGVHRSCFSWGRGLDWRILRCDNANREMPHAQPVPARAYRKHLLTWSASSSYLYHVSRRSFGAKASPCLAESATAPMEKMPHRGDGQIWCRTAERLAKACCVRHPPGGFDLS